MKKLFLLAGAMALVACAHESKCYTSTCQPKPVACCAQGTVWYGPSSPSTVTISEAAGADVKVQQPCCK